MSKVMLTAFNNKLQGIMEIPDNWDKRDIWLTMDMEMPSLSKDNFGKKVLKYIN